MQPRHTDLCLRREREPVPGFRGGYGRGDAALWNRNEREIPGGAVSADDLPVWIRGRVAHHGRFPLTSRSLHWKGAPHHTTNPRSSEGRGSVRKVSLDPRVTSRASTRPVSFLVFPLSTIVGATHESLRHSEDDVNSTPSPAYPRSRDLAPRDRIILQNPRGIVQETGPVHGSVGILSRRDSRRPRRVETRSRGVQELAHRGRIAHRLPPALPRPPQGCLQRRHRGTARMGSEPLAEGTGSHPLANHLKRAEPRNNGPDRQTAYAKIRSARVRVCNPSNVTWNSAAYSPFSSALPSRSTCTVTVTCPQPEPQCPLSSGSYSLRINVTRDPCISGELHQQ